MAVTINLNNVQGAATARTAAQWVSDNPIIPANYVGFETDTGKYKLGDGVTAWNSLSYPSFGVSGIAWGAITGTLSSQTDLQSALDLKANLAGASFTGDVSVTTSGSGDTLQLTNSGSGTTLNILNSGSGDFFKIDTNKLVVSNNGNLAVDTNTLFVDAVNNRVGILRTPTAYGLEIGSQAINFANSYNNGTSQNVAGALMYIYNSSIYFHTRTNSITSIGGFKFIGALTANSPVQVAHLNQSGALYLGGAAAPSGQLHVNAQTSATIGAIIQAAAGQTANTFEIRDSGGNIELSHTIGGGLFVQNYSLGSTVFFGQARGSGTVAFELQSLSNRRFRILANATSTTFESSNQTGGFIFNKAITPASLADASAQNNSIYYSTDASKLVYKDSGGVVNDLY